MPSQNEGYPGFRSLESEEFYVIGRSLERAGAVGDAMKAYEEAWKRDPESEYLPSYLTELALNNNVPAKALFYMSRGRPAKEIEDETLRKMVSVFIRYSMYREALYLFSEIDDKSAADSLFLGNLYEKTGAYREALFLYREHLPEDQVSSQMKFAEIFRAVSEADSAIHWYEKVLESEPSNISAMRGIALAHLQLNHIEEGEKILLEILENPNGADDRATIEALGRVSAAKGDYKKAAEYFSIIYKGKTDIKNYHTGRTLSVYLFLSGDFEGTLEIVDEVLASNENDYEMLHLKGSALENMAQPDSAVTYYNRSLEINDKYSDTYRSLILLYLKRRDIDSAYAYSLKFTEKQPNEALSWALLGSVQNIENEFDAAAQSLQKAMELGTATTNLKFELALALERTGEVERAIVLLKEVVSEDSTHSAAANYLGYLWAERGENLEESRVLIEKALEVEPENGAYLDSYGWVLYQLGEYKLALEYLLKSVEKIDYDYVVFYHLADTYFILGESEKALEYYRKANEFDNPHADEIREKIEILHGEGE